MPQCLVPNGSQTLFLSLTVFRNSSRKFWGPLPLKLHTIQSDSAPQFEKISLAQRAYRVAKLTRLRVSYRTAKRYIENSLASSYRPAKRFSSPKTPDVSFRQHGLCEQSASRRSDRQAIALRASTAQSLRDFSAQDDTRGELVGKNPPQSRRGDLRSSACRICTV